MWMGVLKVAEKSGLVDKISKKMEPIINKLFMNLHKNKQAKKYVSLNIIANILGLGWAATPFGLKAMEKMQEDNKNKDTASDDMCMFLLINISSVQLISINILAYRIKYNSSNPSEIIVPGIIATSVSTIVAIIYAKIKRKRKCN